MKNREKGEWRFNVMEDCLRDLRRLEEILDPVHRYNLGDRAAFIALKGRIESRVVEQAPGKMGRRLTFSVLLVYFWCTFGALLVNYGFQVTSRIH